MQSQVRLIFQKSLIATFMFLWFQHGSPQNKFSPAEDPKSFNDDSDEHEQIIPTPNAEWFHNLVGKILLLITQNK